MWECKASQAGLVCSMHNYAHIAISACTHIFLLCVSFWCDIFYRFAHACAMLGHILLIASHVHATAWSTFSTCMCTRSGSPHNFDVMHSSIVIKCSSIYGSSGLVVETPFVRSRNTWPDLGFKSHHRFDFSASHYMTVRMFFFSSDCKLEQDSTVVEWNKKGKEESRHTKNNSLIKKRHTHIIYKGAQNFGLPLFANLALCLQSCTSSSIS